ncbi:Immunity protein SdpI [Paenibacillus solanacearum]|uniref:Immunity protein SdpI n=1 Tax=Paenibacillus solanacearum TaxID=2048548 RepID=A0A916K6T4_9BACL|nr:DUF1648 domain-containing protein [Paenibacillus solanacearum]CAG7648379.1 Immunity protein SdpI [Paenibacillus solanacearum]
MKKWIFPIAAAAVAALASLFAYADLPESMVIHFNISEQPDRWIAKPVGAFLLPALILAVSWTVMMAVKFEQDANKRLRVEASIGVITAIVSSTLLAVHLFTIAYNLGYELRVATVTTVIIGFVFLIMGNLMPRLPQNSLNWPKLPVDIQRKASRFIGRFMFVLGIAFVLLAALPGPAIFPTFCVLLAVFIVVTLGAFVRYLRM